MKHLIVINPRSFPREAELNVMVGYVRSFFINNFPGAFDVHISRYPRDGIRVVRRFIENAGGQNTRIYAIGGHGIISDCINGMIDAPNAQLAIMPYGMSSNFIRAFKNNAEALFKDFSLQCISTSVTTDLISTGDKHFVNYCSIGLDAGVSIEYFSLAEKFPRLINKIKDIAYIFCVPMAINKIIVPDRFYEMTVDGKKFDGHYANITISNCGLFGRNKSHTPMAHPADGMLDVMTMKDTNKLVKGVIYYDQIRGRYHKHPDIFTHIRGREIVVKTADPVCCVLDGERNVITHLDAKIVPGAIQIVSPGGDGYAIQGMDLDDF